MATRQAYIYSMDIKALRNKLGLTQEQLALRLGVQSLTVSRWERGVSQPSPMAQAQLARLEQEAK